jgi:RNA-directed DNA polymerase
LLNELYKELEKSGHRYVRYADYFSNYVKSNKSAKRVGNSIYKFLRDKLHLLINRKKSGIRRPSTFEVLGYSFVLTYKKREKGKSQFVVKKSKWEEFKLKLKQPTKKTNPMSFDELIQRINWWLRGWINYFELASIQVKLKKLKE